MPSCHTSDTFKADLKARGVRATAHRIKVLTLLHFRGVASADELYNAASPQLDRVTVYRTLQTLEEVGMVRRTNLSPTRAIYELSDHHAHYVICTQCGAYEVLLRCTIPRSVHREAKQHTQFAHIDGHALQFFGQCKKCALA